MPYLREIILKHVSGQLKIAPEHSVESVLDKMGKPGVESLVWFKKKFDEINISNHLKQFLTYYLIAAHPGCAETDMRILRKFVIDELNILPEQIQIFTPTPSTYSSLMYYTETDPFTLKPLFVEKSIKGREIQKSVMIKRNFE